MLLVVALMVPMLPSFAFAASKEDFAWSVMDDGTVCIDSFTGKEQAGDTHVVIPDQIDGLPVTKLAQEAFAYNDFVDTIVIPESVTFIGNSAFYHCSDLDAIVFRGQAPELEFTVAEGSSLKKLFVLDSCQIGTFCARLVNDLGAERAAQVEVLTFGDLSALDEAYSAYVAELAAPAPVETTQPAEPEIISVEIPMEINPLYEGVVSDAGQVESAPSQMLAEPEYGTVEEAVVALREGMKNRANTITVYVHTTVQDHSAIFYEIFDRVFDHTGVPTEGDYLAFHYKSRGGNISGSGDGQGNKYLAYRYDLTYYDTTEQQEEMDAAVETLLAKLNLAGKSDYEKICAIYDWMCENITYDYDHLEAGDYPLMYTAYAALVNKTAVCQGYANLFYRLALEAGVDNRIVSGIGNGGPHAWNIVKLDGLYYDVDATWDAIYLQAGAEYNWFLRCEETFEDHTRDPEYDTDRFHTAYPMAEQDYVVESVEDSGNWGGLSWNLADGVLIITGNGPMEENPEGMPWVQAGYAGNVTAVVIQEGVTSVAPRAFYGHRNLEKVLLPDSMQTIGDEAFANCGNIGHLVLPAGITAVGSRFVTGSDVMGITFWGDVPAIDENAFGDMRLVVLYPDDGSWPENIRQNYGGSTEWYTSSKPAATGLYGNIRWALMGYGGISLDGVGPMQSQADAKGYPWHAHRDRIGFVEMMGITSIGAHAFENCTNLADLYIIDGIGEIGAAAFSGCSNLSWISFSADAPEIAEDAFTGVTAQATYFGNYSSWVSEGKCRNYGGDLTWIEQAYMLEDGEYGDYFWEVYSDGTMSLSAMGDVGDMESLPSAADYPWAEHSNSVKTLYLYDVRNVPSFGFENFTALETVQIHYNTKRVETRAFAGCSNLKAVDFRFCDWVEIAADAFTGVTATATYGVNYQWPDRVLNNYGGNLTWKVIPNLPIIAEGQFGGLEWSLGQNGSVLCISGNGPMPNGTGPADYPWSSYLSDIRSVYLVGVTTIGDYAFSGAPRMTEAVLSTALTQIGACAFSDCSRLHTVQFRSAPPVIAEDAFTGVTGATMLYPYSQKELWTDDKKQNYGGFLSWSTLIEHLDYGTLDNGVQWQILENGEMYFYESGAIETMAAGTYPWSQYASQIISVDLGEVTSIGDAAFADMTALERMSIPNTVTAIGADVFRNCTNLTEMFFQGSAPAIAETAFAGVNANIYYPGSDSMWPESARKNYGGNLTWVASSYEVAGGYWCDMYWSLNSNGQMDFSFWGVMDNLSSASDYPWYPYRDQIVSVSCYSPENIGTYAFQGCTNLTEVTIGGNCLAIGNNAFADCTGLQSIFMNGMAPQIGQDAFQNVTATVVYQDNGTWTEENKLNYGGNLEWIREGQDNWIIGSGQYGENLIWELTSNGTLTIIGSGEMLSQSGAEGYPWQAYGDRISVIELYDLTSVGDYAFAGMTGLNQIMVYSTLNTIGQSAFAGCTNLCELFFRGDAPVIADNAFTDVTASMFYPTEKETWYPLCGNHYGGNLSWYSTTFWLDGGEIGNLEWDLYTGGSLYIRGAGEMPNLESAENYPWYLYRNQISSVVIEAGVRTVGDHAFAGMETLYSISLERDLTAIGTGAFRDCTALESIYFYGSAPVIADDAFGNVTAWVSCPENWSDDDRQNYGGNLSWSGYSYSVASGYYGNVYWELYSSGNLDLSGYYGTMEAQTSAEGYPWYPYRDQITVVRLYDLACVADNAFAGYTALTELHLNDEVYGIGAGAFRNCTALGYIWIGDAEPFVLAKDAFAGVTSEIFYPNNHPSWKQEDLADFEGDLTWNGYSYTVAFGSFNGIEWNLNGEGTLYLYGGNGDGIMAEQEDASGYPWYAYRDRIRQVDMGEVTTVGAHAFRDCPNLDTVYISNRTTRIGDYAFASDSLEYVFFMGAAPEISDTAFYNVSAWVAYPEGFAGWDTAADQNYGGNLSWDTHSVWVAGGVTDRGLDWTVYSGGNLNLNSGDGYIEDFSPENPAPWQPYADWITSAHINQTNYVGAYTFAGLYNLKEVHYNGYIASLGDGMFRDCTALTEVLIPDSVGSLGSGLFSGCADGLLVRFLGYPPALAADTFAGASVRAEYDGNITDWANVVTDSYGGNVEWVNVNDTSIASGNCGPDLTWVLDQNYVLTISGTGDMYHYVTSSGAPWAEYAADIQEVCLPEGLTGIGYYNFYGFSSLTSIHFPTTLARLYPSAIGACPNLTELYFEGSAPVIDDGAMDVPSATVTVPGYDDTWLNAATLRNLGENVTVTDTEGSHLGICGEDLVWRLDPYGNMMMFGTGAMYDYSEGTAPWADFSYQIYNLSLAEGVTGIGDYAFAYCSYLSLVTFPDSLQYIGRYAFSNTGIAWLTLPDSLLDMGEYAFAGCTSMTGQLVIPGSVAQINTGVFSDCTGLNALVLEEGVGIVSLEAFRNCLNLTEASLPSTLFSMAPDAVFSGCSNLERIWVETGNRNFYSIDGVLLDAGLSMVLYCPKGFKGLFAVPDTVYSIEPYAFANVTGLTEIRLPESLEHIAYQAFANCEGLTSVVLPRSQLSLSDEIFYNCNNLTDIYVPDTVTVIAEYAFLGCPNRVIHGHAGSAALDHAAMYGIPYVEEDHSYNEIGLCIYCGQEEVTLSACGENVFWTFSEDGTLRIFGDGPMYDFVLDEQPWGDVMYQIRTVEVEEGVSSIGDNAFYSSSLSSVSLPGTVTSIGNTAFAGCYRLLELVIPEGVTTIGGSAFMGSVIRQLSLPASLMEMDPTDAMYGMYDLVELTVAEGNLIFRTADNVLFSQDMTRLLYYPSGFTGTYKVPEGVTTLAKLSFENTYVYEVILPRTVTTIEEDAFIRSDVAYVTMPDSVTQIHANAFRYCNGVTFFGHAGSAAESFAASHAFDFEIADHTYGEDGLCIYCGKNSAITGTCGENLVWSLNEDTGVLTITGSGAMEDYTSRSPAPWQEYDFYVDSVVLDDGITHIGDYAFYGLTWLDECPKLPENLQSIGMYAFKSLNITGDLVIPDNVTDIGSYAFNSCGLLTSVQFGSKVQTIGDYAFERCSSLSGDLAIPDSVTEMGYGVFLNCKNLNGQLTLSGNLKTISRSTFEGCGFTGDLVIPDSVTEITDAAFYNCRNFNGELTLSENLQYIGRYAFSGCGFAGALVIPDSVSSISSNAFDNMENITEVVLGSGLLVLGSSYAWTGDINVFNGCTGVEHICFTSLNAPTCYGNPFASMAALKTVSVPGDHFSSYESILKLVPAGVKIRTDAEKIAVTGLKLDSVYSKTAVLSWEPHFCAEEVESYSVFRDGLEIGTSESCTFTDRTLEPGKGYAYTVCANFGGNKQSVASDVLTAISVEPAIGDITTDVMLDGISRVAMGYSTVAVHVPAGSNLLPLGKQVTSVALYYGDGTTRNFLGYGSRAEKQDSGTTAVYTFNWDVALVADGDYTLTAVITDVDGTSASYSETVTVDNTAPAQLELIATSSEQVIALSWSFAPEIDAVGYRLYRKTGETGTFQLLRSFDSRYTQSYTDADVAEEEIYYYFVTSVDAFGRESEASVHAGATLMLDAISPKVTKLTPAAGNYLTGTVAFTVKAEDNVSVTDLWLSYSLDEGATWVAFGKGTRGELDTTALPDGPIWVKAVAADAKGNVSDDFIQKYRVDNTGPEQVTGLDFVATSVTLTLSWKDVADEDIGWFLVEKKLDDGSYQTVNSNVTALGINIQGLTPATAYTYRVTAYDRFGNAGIPSEDLVAKTTADAAGPVITQILPAAGRYSEMIPVSATVKDEYCVSSVTLQYSVDNINWTDITTQTYTDIQAVRTLRADLSLEKVEEGYVYIRAIALDNEGNASKNESFVQHRVDKTAPAAPVYVTATGGDGYIEISWQSSASDVTGFALYRSESSDGDFVLMKELNTLNFFDRDVEDEKTYYYQVAAKDSAGNWSQRSLVVSAASLADGELPQIYSIYPANNSILGLNNATISVLAADNGGLQSIVVEYSHDGEDYQTLAQLHDIGQYSAIAAGTLPMAEFANGDTAYIRATATDGYGNVCHSEVNTYTIDTQAPGVLTVAAEHTAGCVTLRWTGAMEADLAGYRIYRKVPGGSYTLVNQVYGVPGQSEYSYVDGTVSGGTYIYLITAVNNVNNSAGMESGQVTVPVSSKPKAVLNCDAVMVAKAQYVIDASGSYDNSAIVSYQIDFGDGTEESTSAKAIHAYNEVGTYIITLTVTDDEGNTNITTKRVTVKSGDLAGTARIRIVDENGAPVPNAPVYFDLGEESQVIRVTDSSGYVTFTAEVGTHTVGCVIANNEWLPVKKDIIITAGEETSVSMTLVNKPIVEGSFEIKRMTLEEIKAAGIDITAPENQYYVEVHLNLRYDNMDLQTSIIAGPGGTSGTPIIIPVGGGGGGNIDDDDDGKGPGSNWRVVFPTVLRPYSASEEVAVALLDIPVGVSTLKEFFDVKLHVMNNASSEFSMLDNVITLNVPDGLTLMDTYNTDPQTVRIAEIKGQTSETLEWILRGDAIGEYYLDADYSGILSQFNEPIRTNFKATEPIEVYGMSNLKLIVDVAQELDRGTLYYNVSLVNEGEIDVYRPNITTSDVLIEMELFDRTNAEKAAYYDFDVMSIEKENLSVNLNTLPDVLNPGDRLTMHYMNVADTTYTECRMALTSMLAEYENTYGLQVEMKERPISFFLANLSTSVNAYEKAAETFDYNGSKGAYDYIMTDSNFVYWCMANNKEGLNISGDGAESLFEVISGDWSDALGKDDQEQARAMVLRVLELASTENAFSAYANVLNWIALFQSVINGKIPGKQITVKDAEYLGLALEDIQNNRKWELYVAINGVSYQASDKVIVEAWAESITDALGIAPADDELINRLHKVYSDKVFQYVWEEFGIKNDYLDVLTEAASDVASDISVYIAAQSDINTYTFYLDELIANLGQDADSRYLRTAAKDILEVITEGDIMASVIENTIEDGAWKLLDTTIDAAIKKAPVVNKVMLVLKISADVMDLLFNINERHDVANNIRFVDALSDAAKASTKYWRSRYMSSGSNYASEHYMMMISLMLDIRAAGESQAAQYGVTYETGIVAVGSGALFRAAAAYSNAPLEIETWYQWRDYVEDKISRCRIQLLKNPVSTDVNEKTAPVVTFDYASGQTAQRFGEEYVYSLNGGRSWTSCDGSAIAVSPSMNATELRVRRKDTAGNESLTAVVPIYGPADLDHSGIQVKETATGYRVENLDNDELYQVTFSETPLKYAYGEELDREVPAGSYSYEILTNVDYGYVYVRMLASSEHYDSYVSLVPIHPMQELTVEINGTGYVTAQEYYEYGENATIVAAPLEGWLFQGWYVEEERVGTDLSYTLEMTEAKTITAKFMEIARQEDGAKLDPETMQAIGFGESTSAEDVMSYYEALDLAAKVINSAGEAFTGSFVGTGCLVSVGGWEFTVVISGDVDGNGEVDVYDLRKMLDCMNEEITLEGAYYEAACFTGEDELSIFDIRAALDYMNGKTETP